MRDILGKAILEFYKSDVQDRLYIIDKDGYKEEMQTGMYFRSFDDMPYLEQLALECCRGRILEVGSGAGSHALILQDDGFDVTALEISPLATIVAKERGVAKTVCQDIFLFDENGYDTILLLMNGIGLVSTIAGLHEFLELARGILSFDGQILFDSSGVSYLVQDIEKPTANYYGEVEYRYEYKGEISEPASWLYIDKQTLVDIAATHHFDVSILYEDEDGQYLAKLTRRT